MAAAIAAVVLTTSVIAFQAISRTGLGQRSDVDVTVPNGDLFNLYGLSNNVVVTASAPQRGATLAMAETMRAQFVEDVSTANAVFCLGRNIRSTVRPSSLSFATNSDGRALASPEAFRQFLDPSGLTFTSYRGVCSATNLSVFVLNASSAQETLAVRAIYEVDMINASSPAGTYASVRRYEGSDLTHYYHVFYDGETNTFQPLTVFFERDALPLEGNASIDNYKQAANRTFAFVWWPDPAALRLEGPEVTESFSSAQPRAGYVGMANRTSFFFVVPAFPSL